MSDQPDCPRCTSTGWVCENHHDTPWETKGGKVCGCGGAGEPCPDCNTGEPPRFIAGGKVLWTEEDVWAN